jgi:asparagine synthase (glutamine-hydrolysing)
MVHDTLAPSRIRGAGFFRPEVVDALIRAHEARQRDHSRDIWTLLMFQTWFDALRQPAVLESPRRRVVA